jgi:hypothetical protein
MYASSMRTRYHCALFALVLFCHFIGKQAVEQAMRREVPMPDLTRGQALRRRPTARSRWNISVIRWQTAVISPRAGVRDPLWQRRDETPPKIVASIEAVA